MKIAMRGGAVQVDADLADRALQRGDTVWLKAAYGLTDDEILELEGIFDGMYGPGWKDEDSA